MPRSALTLGIIFIVSLLLMACSATPAAPTAQPTTAPTRAPQAAPTTAAPAARGTPAPLPPQPTSPPVPTKAATPYVTPTFSPILNFPAQAATATSAPAAQATPAAAAAGPTASGTATGVRSELKVEFVKTLGTAEEVDDISLVLRRVPGIFAVSGNEVGITIVYDAGLILPSQIRLRLDSMGHPVKP